MSVKNPDFIIPRQSVVGSEGEWVKMFDPPKASPATREFLLPTNPVPEFMAAQGLGKVSVPHTTQRTLLHGINITGWDGKKLLMYTFTDPDFILGAAGVYPGPTFRIPRGVIFHCKTHADGPPPHTIHWHGIEPTAMNDGVGHCSMEIGDYTYQWQPNYVGSYFYHCHRNTTQHFEFGLFGELIVEPPDAFDDPGEFGKPGGYPRRIAANLNRYQQFPGFVGGDPVEGVANGDPHAFTVPYDVEALWVLDDVDSVWHALAPDARATFPKHGDMPGVNDNFHGNAGGAVGPNNFFAFHDFNPDYFFSTGVPFMGPVGSTADLKDTKAHFGTPDGTVPAALNSGVAGMQVAVNAKVNQTILIRPLCAAYASTIITFPVDALVIAFDGRALGVPPFGRYNRPFMLKAGMPLEISTARRFDVLIRTATPVNSFAKVEFRNNVGNKLVLTGRIPIVIS